MTSSKATPLLALALVALMAGGLTGCASAKTDAAYNSSAVYDPIEPVNRGIFAFNDVLDRFLLEPVATAYETVVPDFMRNSIRSFLNNLKEPIVVANSLLQGDLKGAGTAATRFVINTTAGIGGLIDVAADQGYAYKSEDFGQTLAVWGFGEGFYVVLPVFGPSTLRDTGGLAVDVMTDPVRIYAHNTDNDWIYYTRGAVDAVDQRARMLKAVKDLRKNSLDYYAAVRSAYTQKRRGMIKNASPATSGSSAYDMPDYSDKQ